MKIIDALKEAYGILKDNEIDTYILDAQVILAFVLKKSKMHLMLNRDEELDIKDLEEFKEKIQLRAKKMPVKYIIKQCEFMGLDLYVEPGVLIPRPDTEILVEETLKRIREYNYSDICDLCTGSGAIGLSIAHYENVHMNMIDISDTAIKVSSINKERLGLGGRVQIIQGDLLNDVMLTECGYDCIVSNPPYIEKKVIDTLMVDVKEYEPHLALDGGEDGLIFYRRITEDSIKALRDGGMLAFEIGHDQRESVSKIMLEWGFKGIETFKDYGGNDRVVLGYKR